MEKYHAKLFKKLSKLLEDRAFIEKYSTKDKAFSRERILSFKTVTLLILQLLKSSLKTELKNFYTTIFRKDEVVNWVSASALCQARQKIKYLLFIDLYKLINQYFYRHIGGKRWFHFRLLAVDGSEINLPSSKELLEDYGCHHTNSIGTQIPQARISYLCDVKNYITLDAQIESFRVGEQTMFEAHLRDIGKNDLITADANYGHFRILKLILSNGADYCIRMSMCNNFVKDFLKSGKQDAVLTWIPSCKTKQNCQKHRVDIEPIKVRLVRIDLSSGITEVLAVSLTDQQKYSYQKIKELYDERWGAEEEIKKYLQRLMVEFFSSLKTNGILQDFYANVFVLNLVGLIADPVHDQIDKDSASQKRKHKHQINWASAIGDVKRRTVLLFLRSLEKIKLIIESIQKSFRLNTEAVRKGRKFPRDKRKKGARKKAFIQYKPI